MFPRSFNARIAERMAIWGAMIAFLFLLYATTEIIQFWKMAVIGNDMRIAIARTAALSESDAALARVVEQIGSGSSSSLEPVSGPLAKVAGPALADDVHKSAATMRSRLGEFGAALAVPGRPELNRSLAALMAARAAVGKALLESLEAINGREAALLASNRQNKLLITLLALFVIGQILFREYRWLAVPMVRMAHVLRTQGQSSAQFGVDAMRRDEIGTLAQALNHHFALAQREQQAATEEKAKLSERLSRQDAFKRASTAFQDRISGIVQELENHSGRMSTASHGLASLSSDADLRAGASAQSTERVAQHVDSVASSIKDVAASVTSAAVEAEKTSTVATGARELVAAASGDAAALTKAARTVEHVIALIEDVANQTNLLALNATIEAARAGEMGRGFGVVASEVKQLATRTSRATEDVRGGLEGITAASARIEERIARLVASIEQVDAAASVIAASMREQEATAQAITSSTERTAEDVRDVAETVRHVAGMIGESKQAAELVTRVSTDLGRQAADLRAAVETYLETSERIAA